MKKGERMQKLSKETKKNKNEYINNYNKENTKRIQLRLKNDEYNEFIEKYEKLKNKISYKQLMFKGLDEFLKEN